MNKIGRNTPNIVWKAKHAIGYTVKQKSHEYWYPRSRQNRIKTSPKIVKVLYQRRQVEMKNNETQEIEKAWRTEPILEDEFGGTYYFKRGDFFYDPPQYIQNMRKRLEKHK